jgi:pimeloyl-ACP methyl ester carboxylesterase
MRTLSFMTLALAGLAASSLSGCELPAPQAGRLIDGGPHPIAEATFEVRARHTDLLPVRVLFPSDGEGRPALPEQGRRPALVFIHGGAVPPEQYRWLAERLARRGFVVALPSHTLDLAIFAIDNGRYARELLVSPPAGSLLQGLVDERRIGIAGHSLGGVVSTKLALEGGFGALGLLASFPDPADGPRLPSLGLPSLSLAGAQDCLAPLEETREAHALLPSPTVFASLEGVTHFQFTASEAEDLRRNCPPTTELSVAHERIAETLERFLRAALDTGGTGADLLRGIPGLEVTER